MKKFKALGYTICIVPRGTTFRAYVKKGGEPEQIVPGFHFPEVEAYDKAIEFIQARRNQEPPSHANGPELKDWYTRRGFTQEGE